MKKLLISIGSLVAVVLLCVGAASIDYNTYMNNAIVYTNVMAKTATFTNSLSAAGFNTSGTTNATLTGNLLANGGTFTNGITAGASTFTGTVTVTNSAAASGGVDVQAVTGSTNYVLKSSINGATQFTLYADAANTLAQRNGANAQTFRVYNTYANSGTDYERGVFDWITTANTLRIGTDKGGTGTSRSVQFIEGGTNIFYIDGATGNVLFNTDNAKDIGASGATRPRNYYGGGTVRAEGGVTGVAGLTTAGGQRVTWSSHASIISMGDGLLLLQNSAQTDFGRVMFGSSTTNYPAIATVTNVAGMPYLKFTDATGANLRKIVNAGHNGGRTNVLTDATATSVLWISVPNTNRVSGKLVYEVFATDGTESQGISGECKFVAIAKGTAVTAQIADVQTTAAVSAGTLTATIASNVATNNVFAITINSDTSLTSTNHVATWRIESPGLFDVNAL